MIIKCCDVYCSHIMFAARLRKFSVDNVSPAGPIDDTVEAAVAMNLTAGADTRLARWPRIEVRGKHISYVRDVLRELGNAR